MLAKDQEGNILRGQMRAPEICDFFNLDRHKDTDQTPVNRQIIMLCRHFHYLFSISQLLLYIVNCSRNVHTLASVSSKQIWHVGHSVNFLWLPANK